MKYVYTDKLKGVVVFECEATSILEADKLYTTATGKDPVKQPFVGCESKP